MARTKRKVNPLAPGAEPAAIQQRIYKVGGYARLSVEDSGRSDADTIEAQKELIENYIVSQQDMELCGLYCDNGRTGTNFQRPEFERLMDDVRGGKIDCIVVKDLSRFGRNYKETGNYLERIFPFLDVRFVAVNDSFDTLTAERTNDGYIVPLKNIINEAYSKDISRKVSSALAVKRQAGEFLGSWAAYGYRKCAEDKHKIEPDPATAPVVKEIFNLRLQGLSAQKIARLLNDRGTPSPGKYHYLLGDTQSSRYANSKWSVDRIKKILANEVYLGHMVQGRKHSGLLESRKQYMLPQSEWIVIHNTHEPIIDKPTFDAVQEMNEKAHSDYQSRLGRHDALGKSDNILRKLVFCADCGRPLVRYKQAPHGKHVYYTYICPTHADNPATCPKKYLHEVHLLDTLWAVIQHEIVLAGDMKKLADEYNRSPATVRQQDATERQIAAAKQTLVRRKSLYDGLYQNYIDHLMDEREYMELKHQYRAEIEQAQAQLAKLERQKDQQKCQTIDNPWLKLFGSFANETKLTDELAHALIERIEVDAENHIEITLRYRDEYRTLAQMLGKAVPA